MRRYPVPDPGTPDLRSPGRYLLWVAARQRRSLAAGMGWGVLWMGAQAVSPAALGAALDGVREGDRAALVRGALVLLGLGLVGAFAGIMRHRCAVSNFVFASIRTQQLVLRHAATLGGSLPDRVPSGEGANIAATDAVGVARCLDITARTAGAAVSFVLVGSLLLRTSIPLGIVVLVGVPALTLGIGPLLKPLHRRQQAQRSALGEASTLAADTVAGLRVLRGIGGEAELLARYRLASQRVRAAGVASARIEASLDSLQVLLPGIFVVTLTVLGARMAVDGSITPGQLLAFYGYAAFLVTPLRTATEAADKTTRALVSAGRVIDLLRLEPLRDEPAVPATPGPGPLHDPDSGLTASLGVVTAVACGDPEIATALADRLAGYVDSDATLGGVPLRELAQSELRRRVLLSDPSPWLFRGPLRSELDPTGRCPDSDLLAALSTASALDVLDSLDGGLDGALEERARELSGGQRQRLVLARALLTDADVLVLDEPTSAVDAHTESRIAAGLRAARQGRTTVVLTASPLVLEQADHCVLLVDGVVTAEGTHVDLLADPAYRAVVSRDLAELP